MMRTATSGIMPLCGCGWRYTHGRFYLPWVSYNCSGTV